VSTVNIDRLRQQIDHAAENVKLSLRKFYGPPSSAYYSRTGTAVPEGGTAMGGIVEKVGNMLGLGQNPAMRNIVALVVCIVLYGLFLTRDRK